MSEEAPPPTPPREDGVHEDGTSPVRKSPGDVPRSVYVISLAPPMAIVAANFFVCFRPREQQLIALLSKKLAETKELKEKLKQSDDKLHG